MDNLIKQELKDAEQSAFETWLESSIPSGDGDSVYSQWVNSSDYKDFLNHYVPSYRGYANLGTGMYCITHTDAKTPAELIISMATEDDKSNNRRVGESRFKDAHVIYPINIAVRIRFQTVEALDALEHQLRELRVEHFPNS